MNVTPPDAYSDRTLFGGVTDWYKEPRIPTTIPATTPTVTPLTTHVDTTLTPTKIPTISPIVSLSPYYTPASDTEPDPFKDPSSDHIPPLPATSPFLSSNDDSSDSDSSDTPPSPTHEIPPVEDTPPNSPSSSSLDSSSDALSDSSSGHSSLDHPSSALPSVKRSSHHLCSSIPSIPHSRAVITERPSYSSHAGPSRKRSRSPTTSVPLSSLIPGALSSVCFDLLPPRKRIMSSDSVTNLEVSSAESSEPSRFRGIDLKMDVDVERSDEPHLEHVIDPIETVIEACFDFVDIIRGSGIDVRVEAVIVARDEVETSARGTVVVSDDRVMHPVVPDDIHEPVQEDGAVKVTYETLGDLVQRFHDHTVEILVNRVQVIESIQRD
ncbi:hypothetical protein Tco_1124484 [Tanacetum coccineum]|uniref:Uncharacterized protein n=1 Tax=Tanacetum coccineum TaxID=301880 RepID=A0ABQ5JA77_9ASTR